MKKLLLVLVLISAKETLFSQKISIDDVGKYVGKQDSVKVCGKIFTSRFLEYVSRTPTLLNMDGDFPMQKLTLVIFGEDKKKFPAKPEEYYLNAKVCVSGRVIDYNGKPEIVIRNLNQLEMLTPPRPKDEIVSTRSNKDSSRSTQNTGSLVQTGNQITKQTVAVGNLRLGPSPDFPIVTTIPGKSTVNIIFTNNGWSLVKVKVNTKNGSQVVSGYLKNDVLEK